MSGKDLFVVMYTCIWASLITVFVFYCALSHCMTISDAVLISNAAFLSLTSIMVFVKPVRNFVDKHIIAKL
jgi:hypothetical protein